MKSSPPLTVLFLLVTLSFLGLALADNCTESCDGYAKVMKKAKEVNGYSNSGGFIPTKSSVEYVCMGNNGSTLSQWQTLADINACYQCGEAQDGDPVKWIREFVSGCTALRQKGSDSVVEAFNNPVADLHNYWQSSSFMNSGLKAAIAASSCIGAFIIVLFGVWIARRRKRAKKVKRESMQALLDQKKPKRVSVFSTKESIPETINLHVEEVRYSPTPTGSGTPRSSLHEPNYSPYQSPFETPSPPRDGHRRGDSESASLLPPEQSGYFPQSLPPPARPAPSHGRL